MGNVASTLGNLLAVAGAIVTGPIGTALMVAGTVVSIVAGLIQPHEDAQAKDETAPIDTSPDPYNIRTPTPTKVIVCGTTIVTPSYAYIYQNEDFLHLVLILCNGEITSINKLYFNDEIIYENGAILDKWTNNVRFEYRLGALSQIPINWVWGQDANASNKNLEGIAYIALRLQKVDDLFRRGIPVIKCEITGAKVPDLTADNPLTSPYVSRNDPISFLLYYLLSDESPVNGLGEIDIDSFKLAYTAMDLETTAIVDDVARQVRYFEINGTFKLNVSPMKIVNTILELCYGSMIIYDGKYTVSCIGLDPTSASVTDINADHVVGEAVYTPFSAGSQRFGILAGTYSSPTDLYQAVSYPVQVIEEGKTTIQRDWPFCTTVQQVCALNILFHHVASHSSTLRLEVAGLVPVIGSLYKIDLPVLGITESSIFLAYEIEVTNDLTYIIHFKKYYTRDTILNLPRAAFGLVAVSEESTLPQIREPIELNWHEIKTISNPSAATLSKLRLTWAYDGTVSPAYYEIRKGSSVIARSLSTEFLLEWIARGTYQFSVRSVGSFAVSSDWVTVDVTISGLPEIPIPPEGLTVQKGVSQTLLMWSLSIDPDVLSGGHYFVYFTPNQEGDFSDSVELPGRVPGNMNFLQIDGRSGKYFVRAVNSSGLIGDYSSIPITEDQFEIITDKEMVVSPEFLGTLDSITRDVKQQVLVPQQTELIASLGIVRDYPRLIARYTGNVDGKYYAASVLDTEDEKFWVPYYQSVFSVLDADLQDSVLTSEVAIAMFYQSSKDGVNFSLWNAVLGNYGKNVKGRYFRFYIQVRCSAGFYYKISYLKFGVQEIDD